MDPMTATRSEEEFAALVERTEGATPGPWEQGIDNPRIIYTHSNGHTSEVGRAYLRAGKFTTPEVNANACLIAASPTFRAEAIAARAQLALHTDAINAVREAAKAVTGGNCTLADDDVERLRALAMEAEGLRAERDALRESGAKMTCAARGIPDYEHSFGQEFYNEPPKCIDCGMPKPEFDAARQALAAKGGES